MDPKQDIEMQAPPPAQGYPPLGQAPPGQPPYGQAPYGQPAYGQPPPAYGQPAYGQPAPAYDPYAQPGAAPGGYPPAGGYAAPGAAYGYPDDKSDKSSSDVEGAPLAPELNENETMLRWGFIRKVYFIVAIQLAITAGMIAFFMFVPGPANFLKSNFWVMLVLSIVTMLGYIPLFMFRNKHPHNLIILCVWTLLFSVTIGTISSCYGPIEVLVAFGITAVMTVGLTLFTFIAVRRGMTFRFLEPFLFAGLLGLMVWGFVQFFIHPGPVSRTIYCLLAVILFAAYLVFDTELLIRRFPIDEYIIAAVSIYIDIINMFIYLLQIIGIINN